MKAVDNFLKGRSDDRCHIDFRVAPLQGTVVQILLRFWCIEVMLLVYVVGIVAGQASTPGLQ